MMMELKVSLEFDCCNCTQPVGVTLKCQGKGLMTGHRSVATVKIPCPGCHAMNQLFFEPSGVVRAVSPCNYSLRVPEPSLN